MCKKLEYSKDLTNILKWMEELKLMFLMFNLLLALQKMSYTKKILLIKIREQEILLNAPEKVGEYFTVPKV